MSAELLFDIYTTKSINSSNTSQNTGYDEMWQLATTMDEESLLEKVLLTKHKTSTLYKTLEKKLIKKLSKICIPNDDESFSADESFSDMEKDAFYNCGKYAEEISN